MKSTISKVILVLLSTFLGLALLELAYRLLKSSDKIYKSDAALGWAPKENTIIQNKKLYSFKGREYTGNYTSNNLGFRTVKTHSNIDHGNQIKILAIGDSFTGDFYASNQESWFGILENLSAGKLKLYAYGMGGSGTSQQFRAFIALRKEINPNVLLIQHCSNDPDNDSYRLGLNSIVRNQDLRRPYYKDGEFYFRNDMQAKLYRLLYNNSFLFAKLDNIIQGIQYKIHKSYTQEPATSKQREDDLNHWEDVYRDYVNYARSTGIKHVWSISCDNSDKDDAQKRWVLASEKLGVKAFTSFGNSAAKKAAEGHDVYYADGGHLNDIGNFFAGQALYKEIAKYLKLKPIKNNPHPD